MRVDEPVPGDESPPPEIEALVAEYLERADREGSRALEALCGDHPEHAAALRSAAARLDEWGLATAPTHPEPRLRRVGDFEMQREIGRGGMGVVYEAEQLSLRRRVAVKVLPAHLTLRRSAIERFQREALTAARLKHSSIVEVLAVGSEDDLHWFAMELVEGVPLDRWIERLRTERSGSRPGGREHVTTVVRLAARVADALEHAHRSGVIHRDVKPSNVIVRPDGTPVLTDFGLAREEGLPSLTETGEFAGTPHYVAPEQISARGAALDARTDVFALGVTLYELLTLERPFQGESRQAVLGSILRREPDDPRKRNSAVPVDLATIVLKALEKEPERRYASAGALADDLRAFMEYRPIAARRSSGLTRIVRWARREPAAAGLSAVLAVGLPAVALLAGYVLARRPEVLAAREQARRDEVERLIEQGYLEIEEHMPPGPAEPFAAARALDPSSLEAIAGGAFRALHRGAPAEALAQLPSGDEPWANEPALQRIRADALRALGRDAEAAELEARFAPIRGSTALFIEGTREKLRADSSRDRAGHERALELLTRAMASSKRARPIVHYARAELARRTRNQVVARECAEALPDLWPDSRSAWYWAGLALAPFDPKGAVDRLRHVVELDPGYVDGHNALGASLLDAGDLEGARDAFRRALSINPNFARAHTNLGRTLARLGDGAGALEHFQRSVDLGPRDSIAHSNLGAARLERGDAAGAAESLRRAVEIDPTYAKAHSNLGEALVALGDLPAAIAAHRKSISLDPKNFVPRMNLANALARSGDWDGTAVACREALELDPRAVRMRVLLARALTRQGDRESALDALREARRSLELQEAEGRPADPVAWNALASFLIDPEGDPAQRDPAAGLAAARRAVELSGARVPAILATLAEAHFQNGEHVAAIETEEKAIRALDVAPSSDRQLRGDLERSLARYRAALEPAGR